jgi:hypothetical protein
MTNRFLISVAGAALIAGTGFANAQGMSREGGGAAGGAATQTAPSSERAAPSGAMNHDSGATKGAESPGMKGSEKSGMKAESNEKMPAAKSAQDTKMDTKGEKSKSMSSENDAPKGGKDMKAEGRDSKSGMSAEGRDSKSGNMNAQTKGADSKSSTTTGNAATSATAAPPAEKRTQIVSAIKSERIEETTNVNFNISVGTAVPASVRFHPLPARIVEIYPEWRGYDVIFVHGQYIIVRPQTREIVYIIEG